MQQYTVPQFIDVEDKIFGPITIRQFSILLGAVGPIVLAWKFSDMGMFIFWLVLVGSLALVFAFLKINGQAFHYFILNVIQTLRRPSRRIWYKSYPNAALLDFIRQGEEIRKGKVVEKLERKQISNAKIRDLSLLVNTGGYFNDSI